ncbi:hypothetical protein WJX82_003992 [Trebouxia sp. C0006]
MKSGRPHSIRRFAEEDASNLLTVLVRSSLASNDKLLDELALRILDIGPAPKLCADSWDLRYWISVALSSIPQQSSYMLIVAYMPR